MNQLNHNMIKNVPIAGSLRNASGKTVAAAILVAVMLLLWGRVLLRDQGGPADAAAAEITAPDQISLPVGRPVTVVPVKLVYKPGRHDGLTSDMFSAAGWEALNAVPETKQVIVLEEDTREKQHQQNLEKMAAMLKLEAIIHGADGAPLQVFVNDAILTVGSVLTVQEGPETCELVLKEIRENEAAFDWNGDSITLKMTETVGK